MKKGGGKTKGGSYERDIAKRLSLWVSNDERVDLFRRTHSSGAIATISYKKGQLASRMDGDIMSTHESTEIVSKRLSIECKHYKSLDLWGIITGKGNLIKFWEQTLGQAERAGKHPVLIAKQNIKPELFLADGRLQWLLMQWFFLDPLVAFKNKGEYIAIYKLKDILDLDGKAFLKMLRE